MQIIEKKMRYSTTERLGIIETDRIITKNMAWIFREQPIIDVGVDAIIEKSENGEPAGKFIAAQIKSGEKNFYIKENYLTYYVSNIHYHYWLNLNIPIIIIAYLPKSDCCYWQRINIKTLEKTRNKWKINIPKSNMLLNSQNELSGLLMEIDTPDIFSFIYKYDFDKDYSQELEVFQECLDSSKRNFQLHTELNKNVRKYAAKNERLMSQGYTAKDSKLKGLVKQQSRYLTSIAYRFKNESKLFSEVFPEELYLLEQSIYSASKRNFEMPGAIVKGFIEMSEKLSELSKHDQDLSEVAQSISKNITKPYPSMKMAKSALIDAFETSSYENNTASVMVKALISRVRKVT